MFWKRKKTTVSDITNSLHRGRGQAITINCLKNTLRVKILSTHHKMQTTHTQKKSEDSNSQRRTEISYKCFIAKNLCLSDGKDKVLRKEGSAHDPKYIISSVKHSGCSVMAWVSGADFIDDVTYSMMVAAE